MNPRRRLTTAVVAGILLAAALGGWAWRHSRAAQAADASLRTRLADIVPMAPGRLAPCREVAPPGALVLLALGQSNAANHGQADAVTRRVPVVTPEGCGWAADPLPGGTGRGGSIWSRLPALLTPSAGQPPVVISVLAVDATSIADWTATDSPLRARLAQHLAGLARQGLPPALVLWHQGEADAQRRTSAAAYRDGLRILADLVRREAGPARVLLARSTICRSPASTSLHDAMARQAAEDPRFGTGPDLDQALPADQRPDGCHLGHEGLNHAARLWADAIRTALPAGKILPTRPS